MSSIPKLVCRPLGRNGPMVPRLGLGLMGTSGHYSLPLSDEERFAFLDEAYKMGEWFWDTSDMYGDCEDMLGKWFAKNPEKRKDIFLATKFGIKALPTGYAVDSSPEYCRECAERSLTRLGLPYVDLFYIHHLDKVTPIEKTVAEMAKLKSEGKIKHLGICECSADTLRRAYKVHPIACVQAEYNPFTRDVEEPQRRLLATLRELGVGFVAFSPMSRGLLTGAVKAVGDVTKPGDLRSRLPRFQPENIAKNAAVVDKIAAVGRAKGYTTPQVVLAWLLAQGDDIFGIPGTSKAARLAENLKALEIELTDEEERTIRELGDQVVGSRMMENMDVLNPLGDTPPLES